jgi:hypothetical protein
MLDESGDDAGQRRRGSRRAVAGGSGGRNLV